MPVHTPKYDIPLDVLLLGTDMSSLKYKLTQRERHLDQLGGPLRMRPFHYTKTGLTPTITLNVGNLSVEFLLVGTCVRGRPLLSDLKEL